MVHSYQRRVQTPHTQTRRAMQETRRQSLNALHFRFVCEINVRLHAAAFVLSCHRVHSVERFSFVYDNNAEIERKKKNFRHEERLTATRAGLSPARSNQMAPRAPINDAQPPLPHAVLTFT